MLLSTSYLDKKVSFLLKDFYCKKTKKKIDILLTGKITEVLINLNCGIYGYRARFNNSPSMNYNAIQFIDTTKHEDLKNYVGENISELIIEEL